ncbi:ClpP/crotonase [Cutaneotrichosporon oleaginosum]|uniref:ClpP/crotonase n=1 Tax=Cutaneotrichosporon oleaginosum TaxID=879819 RepID=A0A0J0XPD0_9TREE|nr:ClpP/crotonase [Cutaneotrichosporon oleaginosum]KLT42960.1 ClpP/crotonase [Cutaneotrichosporon oleaginosum]
MPSQQQHDMALRALKLTEVVPRLHRSGILELQLNTPSNLNAFGSLKYLELIKGFDYARDQDDIKAVMVTSTGRFFSAGAALQPGGMQTEGKGQGKGASELYVNMLIDFPKLAVCVLNGPAYGITVTTLPLFDLVYAAPEVSITTPFSRLGICLEGASSVLFQPLFGSSLTSRLLYMAETIPLKDLLPTGMIAEVLPKEGINEAVEKKLGAQLDELAVSSIITSKGLVRSEEYRANLRKINEKEMAAVAERIASQEHKDQITKFQARRAAEKAKKDAAKL